MDRPTTLERAFQLAHSGKIRTVQEIGSALKREGLPTLVRTTWGHGNADLSHLCPRHHGSCA